MAKYLVTMAQSMKPTARTRTVNVTATSADDAANEAQRMHPAEYVANVQYAHQNARRDKRTHGHVV